MFQSCLILYPPRKKNSIRIKAIIPLFKNKYINYYLTPQWFGVKANQKCFAISVRLVPYNETKLFEWWISHNALHLLNKPMGLKTFVKWVRHPSWTTKHRSKHKRYRCTIFQVAKKLKLRYKFKSKIFRNGTYGIRQFVLQVDYI